MIRTRNFLLYVLVLVFLLMGLGTTVWQQNTASSLPPTTSFHSDGESVGVVPSEKTDTRQTTIERLKNKIAQGKGIVISNPPVFTSVDSVPSEISSSTAEEADETETLSVGKAGTCLVSNLSLTATWPKQDLLLSVVEGARVLQHIEVITTTVGTSTRNATSTKTALVLPIIARAAVETSCVSDVAGVSTAGSPLLNTSAPSYQHFSQFGFVGYALDGAPIYGPVSDPSTLDECGGLATPAGYQYHVRTDDDRLVNCFAGAPQPITL